MAAPPQEPAPIVSDQQLHAAVVDLISLDDRLKEVSAQLKPLRNKRRALHEHIQAYLKRSGRRGVFFNDRSEQFVIEQRKRKVKLDDDAIKQRLLRASRGDEEIAHRIYSQVFDNNNQEVELVDAMTRKKTVFGRNDAHFSATEVPSIDPSTLTDARDIQRYAKVRGAYNEIQESVRNNTFFEV